MTMKVARRRVTGIIEKRNQCFVVRKKKLNHRPLPALSLLINGIKISPSQTVKFLGFILDAQLKWSEHVSQKCVAAKRALFAVYQCLRATWGADRRRLLFLYETVVEPIVLYGSSVWISGLHRKICHSKLRSFQRSITLLVTRAFKSAPTLSLLALSNLRPVDNRALERAAISMLSPPFVCCFSDSSRKLVHKNIPLLKSSDRIELVSYPHLSSHPPWEFCFSKLFMLQQGSTSFLPSHPYVTRCYVVVLSDGGKLTFGVVGCNTRGVIYSDHGLFVSGFTIHRAASYAINQSLRFFKDVVSSNSTDYIFDLFVQKPSFLSFTLPNKKLSELEVENLSLLASLQNRLTMFMGLNSSSSGYGAAECLARNSSTLVKSDVTTSDLMKSLIKQKVASLWAEEWARSPPPLLLPACC